MKFCRPLYDILEYSQGCMGQTVNADRNPLPAYLFAYFMK